MPYFLHHKVHLKVFGAPYSPLHLMCELSPKIAVKSVIVQSGFPAYTIQECKGQNTTYAGSSKPIRE